MPDSSHASTPDRYCVAGNPVAHSKSPLIHTAFAAQTAQNIFYARLLVPLGEFPSAIRAFAADGGRGLNVTVPFKEDAFRFADESSAAARQAGAVNTLTWTGGRFWRGDNTDGVGLIRDLCGNHGFDARGAHVLLCGAGGAARGVLADLLGTGPASVTVVNRTVARAQALADRFQVIGPIAYAGYETLPKQAFDLVINATSLGFDRRVPPLTDACVAPHTWCYDLMYGDGLTAFQQWAAARRAARALDGIGMLVEQAAESFFIWRGVRPATAPIIADLRAGRLK